MQDESFEQFKATLRKIGTVIEDFAIENEVYLTELIKSGLATSEALKKEVADRQSDPSVRERVRKEFSEMWKAVENDGLSGWFEELLKNLPPSGKPN